MALTDLQIDKLKSKTVRYEVWEPRNKSFGIRVFPSGQKSWVYMYRYKGKQKRMKLGEYPNVGVAKAHQLHADAVLTLSKGIDPGEAIKLAKTANLDAPTVNDLINEYIERWAKPKKRSWAEDQRILKKEISPIWGNIKAKDIKRRDIVLLLDNIQQRAPIVANRTFAVVRRMFNFAIERDILESTPCSQVKMPSVENQKDRMLSEDEIKIFWNALSGSSFFPSTIWALKMALITGQRKNEIASMRWDEINLTEKAWEIPASKSKNKKLHRVPLSKLAMDILSESKKKMANPMWAFPAPVRAKHIAGATIHKAVSLSLEPPEPKKGAPNKNLTPLFNGIAKFTPHDLRRTAASHMTKLGIPRLVVSKILNHVENSVTAIYDRHTYDLEKRSALEMWSKKLEEIIG